MATTSPMKVSPNRQAAPRHKLQACTINTHLSDAPAIHKFAHTACRNKFPAMPHSPNVPTISLPEKNGACANLKARHAQMAIMLPKLKAARMA